MVVCLELGADLHMAQLMPLPLTVFCFSKIQIGFTFLVPAHLGSPGKRAIKWVCVCVCVCLQDYVNCLCLVFAAALYKSVYFKSLTTVYVYVKCICSLVSCKLHYFLFLQCLDTFI